MKATALKNLNEAAVVKKVGPLFTADQKKTGVLACVSMAQFILESGYGKTDLAQKANNCFGMKKTLSGNTWAGSAWDGKSTYTKKTAEQNKSGKVYYVTAAFRKYPKIEDSIADHSAYLTGAKSGSKLRYAGLKGCADYTKAAQIIKNGGYATDVNYVSKLTKIIKKWGLTKYNAPVAEVKKATTNVSTAKDTLYRVRKNWNDEGTQKGAFSSKANAILCVDASAPGDGYMVFDPNGVAIYPLPYSVKLAGAVDVKKSASDSAATTTVAPAGIYTITRVSGEYGLLKSGAGWIHLLGHTVSKMYDPGDRITKRAKAIGDYMVKQKYHYGAKGNEGSPKSFRESVSKKWRNASCTRYASWVFQAAGYLREGKVIGHNLSNKQYLVDCQIIKANKPFKTLLANKTLKAGDMMISAKASCGCNYASIFAGYDSNKKDWFEAGGPFKGVNTTKTSPYTYTNVGPLYVPYDYSHKVEYIIRPVGKGNGGIDVSDIVL